MNNIWAIVIIFLLGDHLFFEARRGCKHASPFPRRKDCVIPSLLNDMFPLEWEGITQGILCKFFPHSSSKVFGQGMSAGDQNVAEDCLMDDRIHQVDALLHLVDQFEF